MPTSSRRRASTRTSLDPSSYTVDDSGCWVWAGYRDRNGYARLGAEWAHRESYRIHKGEIPPGHEIDHTCSNPPCVNPDHLDAVTRIEHVRRTFERLGKDKLHASAGYFRSLGLTYGEIAEALGYASKESAHAAVLSAIRKGLCDPDSLPARGGLTEDERQEIRDLYALGVTQPELARWYRVDDSNISRTITGRRRDRAS